MKARLVFSVAGQNMDDDCLDFFRSDGWEIDDTRVKKIIEAPSVFDEGEYICFDEFVLVVEERRYDLDLNMWDYELNLQN
jgi:hypothetical protein